jgi:hypothetical protein
MSHPFFLVHEVTLVWLARKEVATRMAVLYTGNILATAFAGLIGAGVFHGMDGLAGLAGWRYVSPFKRYHYYTDFR